MAFPSFPPIICLMGPTASGKTQTAITLAKHLPVSIISVDSAMVYCGMDIGTAKPSSEIRTQTPHQLIDICDPADPYSAGRFRMDAQKAISAIHAEGKIPLLVGGTMLYFRVLQQGLANLPDANNEVRQAILEQALTEGWEILYKELQSVDPIAATRIHANDSQRIARALEVYKLTGKTLTALMSQEYDKELAYHVINCAIAPAERMVLHDRIAQRFTEMLDQGFIAEVEQLYQRGDLTAELPSMRAVGYRQAWDYLSGNSDYDQFKERAVTATRQLAKRQLTWLRSWPNLTIFDCKNACFAEQILKHIEQELHKFTFRN